MLCAMMEMFALKKARKRADIVLQWAAAILGHYDKPLSCVTSNGPGRYPWQGLWAEVARTGGLHLTLLVHSACGDDVVDLSEVYEEVNDAPRTASNVRAALRALTAAGVPVVLDAGELQSGPPDDDVMLLQLDLVYFRLRDTADGDASRAVRVPEEAFRNPDQSPPVSPTVGVSGDDDRRSDNGRSDNRSDNRSDFRSESDRAAPPQFNHSPITEQMAQLAGVSPSGSRGVGSAAPSQRLRSPSGTWRGDGAEVVDGVVVGAVEGDGVPPNSPSGLNQSYRCVAVLPACARVAHATVCEHRWLVCRRGDGYVYNGFVGTRDFFCVCVVAGSGAVCQSSLARPPSHPCKLVRDRLTRMWTGGHVWVCALRCCVVVRSLVNSPSWSAQHGHAPGAPRPGIGRPIFDRIAPDSDVVAGPELRGRSTTARGSSPVATAAAAAPTLPPAVGSAARPGPDHPQVHQRDNGTVGTAAPRRRRPAAAGNREVTRTGSCPLPLPTPSTATGTRTTASSRSGCPGPLPRLGPRLPQR